MSAVEPGIISGNIEVRSPADGRLVGSVPSMARPEVEDLAKHLRAAQPEWEDRGPDQRARVLLGWADWLLDNERRLTELVQAESGKAWNDAAVEVITGVQTLTYYARNGADFLAPRRVKPHAAAAALKHADVRYRPYPLVGMVTPWNAAVVMVMLDLPGALMAGAAVLTKPSELVPLAWSEVVAGFREVGGPDVLGVATGAGDTGAAVVDVVDMVMFTGSTRTGRAIAVRCAERLIPCSLELGGKDAMIVLADADLDRAVAAATWGGMANAGQACVSVERIYVEQPAYQEFVRRLTDAVRAVRFGTDAPGEFATEYGATATEAQLAIIEAHVEDARTKGARITTGGRRAASGQLFEPTVIADADHTMVCMREETFGPTLAVMSVRDEGEAVCFANESVYGLSASVWSGDVERADRLARQLEVGAVNLNNAIINLFQFGVPMGGWKESGLGSRLGGAHGVLKYCRTQAVVRDKVSIREPYWFPVSKRKGRLLGVGARMISARDWRRRLGLRGRR